MLEDLHYSTFSGQIGQKFRINLSDAQSVELELLEATETLLPAPRRAAATTQPGESFSLLFQGPSEPFLPQATYQFEQEALGSFPLFIVPIGAAAEGVQYEAVFSRMPR